MNIIFFDSLNSCIYERAFVDVSINGNTLMNVLTCGIPYIVDVLLLRNLYLKHYFKHDLDHGVKEIIDRL